MKYSAGMIPGTNSGTENITNPNPNPSRLPKTFAYITLYHTEHRLCCE